VISEPLGDDSTFPNNENRPLVYMQAIIEDIFHSNKWLDSWRNGIYPFHHYHSTAHEVLGMYKGKAKVQFGGEKGLIMAVAYGDVVIITAGVAHKNINSSHDFRVVGAYPTGQSWDMIYGRQGERPAANRNISSVPDPKTGPVYGSEGPLPKLWGS
jgi:uncharacterized protein YjlB